jgi:hypothetical protein
VAGSSGPTVPSAAACAGVLYTGALSDAIKIRKAMILVCRVARGANVLQDIIVLTLLAT